MRYISNTAVILNSKLLFKLDNLWMPTAVAPLQNIAWTVAYSCSFPAIHQTHLVSLTCGQTRSGGTNLKLRLFSILIWMSLRKQECQRFFANILSEFQSNPRSNHLVFQKCALRFGKQVQGVSVLINIRNNEHKQCTDMKTESITPEERTKGSDTYREDNQGGDGDQVSVRRRRCARRWWQVCGIISSLMT